MDSQSPTRLLIWREMQSNSVKNRRTQLTYHANGRLFQEVPFVGAEIDGVLREWHASGALAREIPMKEGRRDGLCRQWNAKGELLGAFEMREGTGISRQWHPNGQLQFEASIVHEKFNGLLRQWDEQGHLTLEAFFLANAKVTKSEYDLAQRADPQLPAYPDYDEKGVNLNADAPNPEALIHRLLSSRNAEARTWLGGQPAKAKRMLHSLNPKKTAALVENLYALGAAMVLAVDMDQDTRGNETATKLLIELPESALARDAIRQFCVRQNWPISPEIESGQSHLAVFFC